MFRKINKYIKGPKEEKEGIPLEQIEWQTINTQIFYDVKKFQKSLLLSRSFVRLA